MSLSWIRRQKNLEDMTQRGIFEWYLVDSLAFAERSWIVIAALLFLLDKDRDFLSVSGIICFLLGLLFLSPVYGIFVYFTHRLVFAALKAGNELPGSAKTFHRLVRAVYFFWFPVLFFLNFHVFNLFFATYKSLKMFE